MKQKLQTTNHKWRAGVSERRLVKPRLRTGKAPKGAKTGWLARPQVQGRTFGRLRARAEKSATPEPRVDTGEPKRHANRAC